MSYVRSEDDGRFRKSSEEGLVTLTGNKSSRRSKFKGHADTSDAFPDLNKSLMQILDDIASHVQRRETLGCTSPSKSIAVIKQEIADFVYRRDVVDIYNYGKGVRPPRTRETCRPYGVLKRDEHLL